MRRMVSTALLAAFGFGSAAQGAAVGVDRQFSVSGITVDATAESPTAARDLAMKQGMSLAWKKLLGQLSDKPDPAIEPQPADRELQALILRSEASNERRNTTRYVADVTFHFNPGAVRQLLRRSNMAFSEVDEWGQSLDGPLPAPKAASTHLAVNARFDTVDEWTILRARLRATKVVIGVDVVGRTPNEAQIFINYSCEVEELQAALAQQALALTSSEGQYTLELGANSEAATAGLQ